MTSLEAYWWMALGAVQRPALPHGHEDTQTMAALPAWLEPKRR